MDWDAAYSNLNHVPDSASYPPKWQKEASLFQSTAATEYSLQEIRYGRGERNMLDLVKPAGNARGVLVFVHGGYWMKFDKSFWTHLAAGPLAHGFAVAIPSYTLCPEARIPAITIEVARAIEAIAEEVSGEIRLAGHSAGGHLICRMICADTPLSKEVGGRVTRSMSISGVHDLRPLLKTQMNETLRLNSGEARAESPVLLEPAENTTLTCWVGANELPEFVRQNSLMANIWSGLGADTECVEEPGKHHFNVVEGLAESETPLTIALCS